MHKKDFDKWNKKKKILDKSNKGRPYYHEREIWWCSIGTNVGFEHDGTGKNFDRPVIVLRGFSRETFIAIPLTGTQKEGKFYFYLGKVDNVKSTAILSQIRLVDTKRLIKKIGSLDKKKFKELQDKTKKLLF